MKALLDWLWRLPFRLVCTAVIALGSVGILIASTATGETREGVRCLADIYRAIWQHRKT